MYCRLAAREVSAIKPILDENNVKLVGVGLEELGVQEFIDGKFFDGELYIDTDKKSYNALGFKRFGFFGLFPAVLSSLARAAQSRGKSLGLGGNMAGDGYQNGGALVVGKGGETLLHYVQEEAPDHAKNIDLLKVLNGSFGIWVRHWSYFGLFSYWSKFTLSFCRLWEFKPLIQYLVQKLLQPKLPKK